MSYTIVAPSFVTNTSPSGPTIILSIPFGPSDVFSVYATDLAAKMFIYTIIISSSSSTSLSSSLVISFVSMIQIPFN
jgi:hypothetical protein